MLFFSSLCPCIYLCSYWKVRPCGYSGLNLKKIRHLKTNINEIRSFTRFRYKDFRVYMYRHQTLTLQFKNKDWYKTIMQLATVVVFVVLSLVQVAVVKCKLFNFNNNNHVDWWDNVEPKTVERGSWLRPLVLPGFDITRLSIARICCDRLSLVAQVYLLEKKHNTLSSSTKLAVLVDSRLARDCSFYWLLVRSS